MAGGAWPACRRRGSGGSRRRARVIDDLTFQRIRAKFRATGTIDDELYDLLLRLVRAVIFGGMIPRTLSPTGVWDKESAQDAAHDWITQRLLKPTNNTLLAAFDIGVTPRQLLSSLEMSFRDHLKSQAARSELDNLGRRAGRLLEDDDRFRKWIPQKKSSQSWWGLKAWDDPLPYDGREDDLVASAWALGEVALVRYGSSVGRASPVLSTKVLGVFLEQLFDRVGMLLTRNHIRHVLERRFALKPVSLVSIEGDDVPELADEPIVSEAELEELAALVFSEMSDQQAQALKLRADEQTLEEIAAALSVSRGTADNELKRVGVIIDGYAGDEISRAQLLEIVLGKLS
jgi:hypothetical protein